MFSEILKKVNDKFGDSHIEFVEAIDTNHRKQIRVRLKPNPYLLDTISLREDFVKIL